MFLIKGNIIVKMFETLKKNGISADALKWIALITMLIDHTGASVLEKIHQYSTVDWVFKLDLILRLIGRIELPIYCFLLVEGFYKTHNRKKYALNLFAFALISEIPFEISFMGGLDIGFHNVYWTLLLGMLLMLALEEIKVRKPEKFSLFALLALAAFAGIAQLVHTDYAAIGVMLIFILYQTRDNRKKQSVLGAVAMFYEITAPISFVLTYHYNGHRKERKNPLTKYAFYAFYPIHLIVLYCVKLLIS